MVQRRNEKSECSTARLKNNKNYNKYVTTTTIIIQQKKREAKKNINDKKRCKEIQEIPYPLDVK